MMCPPQSTATMAHVKHVGTSSVSADRCCLPENGPSSLLAASAAGFMLAKRAVSGDEQAFAELYANHHSHVHWLCTRMIFDTSEAEDLTQDIFLRVYTKLDTFRGEALLSTWIHRVAVNMILMHLRRKKRQRSELSIDALIRNSDIGELGSGEFSVRDSVLSGTIDRIALERAIAHLAVGYRICLVLHDVEGYEHHEVARMLNFTQGCSKSQVHKARKRLRRILEGNAEKVCQRSRKNPKERGAIC